MEQPGEGSLQRNWSASTYRFGFNGKENDREHGTAGLTQDYGFRLYNPAIAKFLSVDPLTRYYPSWSPYPFAMNRPIDGVDLDGLEWDNSTDNQGNTKVSVNTKFSVDANAGLSKDQISAYQNAINFQLNNTLQSSSGGKISGMVTFNAGNGNGRVVPTIFLDGDKNADPTIAGSTTFENIIINLYKKGGILKSPEEIAEDVTHELLHTLRLEHPFERTQGADTKLIHQGDDNFLTTSTTDPNIFYNILNYSMINIDGKNLGELWKNKRPTLITKDQINLMLTEIHLQVQGYGAFKWDDNKSTEENTRIYNEYFNNYWFNKPGEDVQRKD